MSFVSVNQELYEHRFHLISSPVNLATVVTGDKGNSVILGKLQYSLVRYLQARVFVN